MDLRFYLDRSTKLLDHLFHRAENGWRWRGANSYNRLRNKGYTGEQLRAIRKRTYNFKGEIQR